MRQRMFDGAQRQLGLVPLVAPPSTVSGVASGVWGAWAGTASGTPKVSGVAAGAWGSWAGTASGTPTVTGVASGVWGAWVGSASGVVPSTSQPRGGVIPRSVAASFNDDDEVLLIFALARSS